MFTPTFAQEMSERLLTTALDQAPHLRDILLCHSYFALYAQHKLAGTLDALLETDAAAWLTLALELLEPK